jgi:hypothetical protein
MRAQRLEGRTDMTELIVAFCNFAKALNPLTINGHHSISNLTEEDLVAIAKTNR